MLHILIGMEFLENNEQLPNIESEINLKVGTSFPSLKIAEHYVEQYAK